MSLTEQPKRLAIIVSHPIQYYAPLYQRLARRQDLVIKVFFGWHAGQVEIEDRGFARKLKWDIDLTDGYQFELVPNVASDPGTHHFLGLINPSLVGRVVAWQPDVVHVTGWASLSHLCALRALRRRKIPTLFRGDSHLLDAAPKGPRWQVKRRLLQKVYSWPSAFLVVGKANRAYYEAFGVAADRLHPCPHSIDVGRFSGPAGPLERDAAAWRRQLDIPPDRCALVFAGKFERRKRPVELMRAVLGLTDPGIMLIMVGGGALENDVRSLAEAHPERFRVLPFQNQSRMPAVYRLGQLFVLPSASGETWGLSVNEALACGRPVLVSDRVGGAADVVDGASGKVFSWSEPCALQHALEEMTRDRNRLSVMGQAAARRAWSFDVARTEGELLDCIGKVSAA
jgi:glycosyltransferase involved in cell wall biosynthesis